MAIKWLPAVFTQFLKSQKNFNHSISWTDGCEVKLLVRIVELVLRNSSGASRDATLRRMWTTWSDKALVW